MNKTLKFTMKHLNIFKEYFLFIHNYNKISLVQFISYEYNSNVRSVRIVENVIFDIYKFKICFFENNKKY